MKKYELLQKAGFDHNQIRVLLMNQYQNGLLSICRRWGLDHQSESYVEQAITKVIHSLDEMVPDAEMEWVCVHTLRFLVLSKEQTSNNPVLSRYGNVEVNWNQQCQTVLNVVLSSLSRKEFDYVIGRYYLFEHLYDEKIEHKLKLLLQGKKQAEFQSKLQRLPKLEYGTNEMVTYLDHIDAFWGNQINQKTALKKHPDSEKWLLVQHSYSQKRAAVISVMLVTLIIILIMLVKFLL